jgi:hypothetical protein
VTPASASGTAGWPALLAWIAVLTMTVGNLAALTQTNVKRMLAYSSIAHAGYILLGMVAAPRAGTGPAAQAAVLFYLLAYTVSNVGAFAALMLAGRRGAEAVSYDDLAGYARRHPAAGFALTFFLISLTACRPTAGFFGKFYIIRATLDAGYTGLAIIAVREQRHQRLLLPRRDGEDVHARPRPRGRQGRAHEELLPRRDDPRGGLHGAPARPAAAALARPRDRGFDPRGDRPRAHRRRGRCTRRRARARGEQVMARRVVHPCPCALS